MSGRISRNFEDAVLCHMDLVYRMALKLSGDSNEAEDLVQETFLRAHRSYQKFEFREYGAKPWLMRILHNAYFSRRSQSAKAPSLLEDLSLDEIAVELDRPSAGSLKPGEVDWDGFDEELKSAMMGLPPEYREIILLWAIGGFSYKEIAEIAGCALGTVMSRLFRARQQLAHSLAKFASDRRYPGTIGGAT